MSVSDRYPDAAAPNAAEHAARVESERAFRRQWSADVRAGRAFPPAGDLLTGAGVHSPALQVSHMPEPVAREWLARSGGWSREELADMPGEDLAARCLWCLACDARERREQGEHGAQPFGLVE